MIGLGRMGGNMVSRLLKAGHRMIAYDQSPDAVQAKVEEGAVGAASLEELAAQVHREAADRLGDGARRRPDDADHRPALRTCSSRATS